jgi:hypothetical protein
MDSSETEARGHIPLVALAGTLDTILKKVGGELGTLLLVAIGICTISIRVSLGCTLEFFCGGRGLCRHRRGVHVAVVARLLPCTTSGPGALTWGGTSSITLPSSSTSEVLMRKLVSEACIGVVGARGIGSWLIPSTLSIVIGLLLLLAAILGILVLIEVALGRIATSILLLLLLALGLQSTRLLT